MVAFWLPVGEVVSLRIVELLMITEWMSVEECDHMERNGFILEENICFFSCIGRLVRWGGVFMNNRATET